jgi:hypothetical protein
VRARVKGFTTFEARAVLRRSFVSSYVICDFDLNVCAYSLLCSGILSGFSDTPKQLCPWRRNTKSFHMTATINWHRNQIRALQLDDSLVVHSHAAKAIVLHSSIGLLGRTGACAWVADLQQFLAFLLHHRHPNRGRSQRLSPSKCSGRSSPACVLTAPLV